MSQLKLHQKPMAIEEQISNLKSNGLIINDEEYARKILTDISYFRLIKGFSLGLKNKNDKYFDGVTFEHIVELYLFNSNFRQILFTQIEKIEINLRSRISNYFSNYYGVLGYLNSQNFKNEEYHKKFIDDIFLEIKRNAKSPFVRNFRENYEGGDLPLYALLEIVSFGSLSKLYKNMLTKDKKAISATLDVDYKHLESWIECIAYVRNICAHYGRLYNSKITKTPLLYKEDIKLGIKNNKVFSIIVCMKYLLNGDKKRFNMFVDELSLLIEKYEKVSIKTMGFLDNWIDILTLK